MRSVILALVLVATSVFGAASFMFQHVPQPVATAVIGEKGLGGQAVELLPTSMTDKQHAALNLAYEVAKENGLKQPELVQAIMLQETGAGGAPKYLVANPGPEAYFGLMQVKLQTAKHVLGQWPSLFHEYGFHTRTDDEIKANLILNERFNVDIATKYLIILMKQYGFTGRELINAYNRGPSGVKAVDNDYHYAIGAERKLASLRTKR